MTELYKLVGAKFLLDSRFRVQVQTPPEFTYHELRVPKDKIDAMLRYQMIERVSKDMINKFEKEIEVENVGEFGGERHTLEFYAFPKEAFKLMIEYIIHETPEHEIQRIKSKQI
jgi:predicted RNA methylase